MDLDERSAIELSESRTVMKAPGNLKVGWVGAPSLHTHGGVTLVTARERTQMTRRGKRTIYQSNQPTDYGPVRAIRSMPLAVKSLERRALSTDPSGGRFKLVLSVDHSEFDCTSQNLEEVPTREEFDPHGSNAVFDEGRDMGDDSPDWKLPMGDGGSDESPDITDGSQTKPVFEASSSDDRTILARLETFRCIDVYETDGRRKIFFESVTEVRSFEFRTTRVFGNG